MLAVGGRQKAGIEPAGVGGRSPSAKLHLRREGQGYRRLRTPLAVLRSGLLLCASFPRAAPSSLRPPEAGAARASPAFWRRSTCFSVPAFRRRRAPSPRSCRAVVLSSFVLLRAAPALFARGRVLPPVGGASAAARPPPGAAPNCVGSWPRSWVRFSAAPASGRCALSCVGACFWARRRRRCAAVVSAPAPSAAWVGRESGGRAPLFSGNPGGGHPQPPAHRAQRSPQNLRQKTVASDVLLWYDRRRKGEGQCQHPRS